MFHALELQYQDKFDEECPDEVCPDVIDTQQQYPAEASAMDIDEPSVAPAEIHDPLAAAKALAKEKTKAAVKPVCVHGAGCYRKNAQHRIEYSHPEPAKKRARTEADGDGGKKKKKKEEVDDAETDVSDSADEDFEGDDSVSGDDFKTESEGEEEEDPADDAPPILVPPVVKPVCSYGTGCYRKSKQHFIDFDHPWKNDVL